jgi:D,D-heptose 1,7-bisphosphate phosphatase
MSAPAVFLDRDGTLVEEAGYIDRLERLRLYPWSLDSVRLLGRGGFQIVIVTNQAGVAHGYYDEAFVRQAHAYLADAVRSAGGDLAGCYHCPHHPEGKVVEYRRACECRKPAPGLFVRAARELDLDLARSYAIGDRWRDVQAARAAGATPVMVRTGYGARELDRPGGDVPPAHVAETLIDATTWILRQRGC